MALEGISNALYHDATLGRKPEYRPMDKNPQEQGVAPVGDAETPAAVKVQGSNTNESDQRQKDTAAREQLIKSIITNANKSMKLSRTRCEFSYHEKINRVSIKILDEETDEVIREIPPEEALEMIEKFMELAGLLFDEKA